jgi:ribosomal protein S18 acetylase RimI-like enzyme
MDIQNSTIADIDEIFLLYKVATELQKAKQVVLWPEFDRALIENEIHENRQWKMLIDNEIACIWASTFSDPLIWGKRNIDPAVYIHRIATNPSFRGRKLVSEIVDWAIKYAKSYNKQFIRMDTVVTMKN